MLIVVAGPPLSGVSGVVRALAERMPGQRVCEAAQLTGSEHPAVVVFVVCAAAPMVESDAVLLDAVAERTDTVLAALTKIDVHRGWRAVRDTNRAWLGRRTPRYSAIAWSAVAAEPQVGPPRLEELEAALRGALARGDLEHRNGLRARESQLRAQIARGDHDEALRRQRRRQAQRSAALAATRLRLQSMAERTCAELRTELRAAAARARRRDRFGAQVRLRAQEVVAEFGRCVDRELPGAPARSTEWAAPPLLPMPPPCAGLENRLGVLLGSVFGIGAGLALGRLLGELLPGRAVGPISAAVGIVVAGWLVRTRRLLAERGSMDRWVGELTAGLRRTLGEMVMARALITAGTPTLPEHRLRQPGTAARQLRRELDAVTAALDGTGGRSDPGGNTGGFRAGPATR